MTESADWLGAKLVLRRFLAMRGVNDVLLASLRHVPPSQTLARLPVSRREVRGFVRDTPYVRPERCTIAKELFWGRGRRVARDEQLALELFSDLARDADVVLDIGANTGVFSVIASLTNPLARVHAFEIVPEVYEVLFENVVRNDVAHRVECHFMGVGEGGRVVHLAPLEPLSSLPTSLSSDSETQVGTRVEFRALDSLLGLYPEDSRILIKIDVEGTETAVFEHGWKAIQRQRPRMVCEILRSAAGAPALGIALKAHGYRLFNITDTELREHDTLRPNPKHRDWLLTCESPDTLRSLTPIAVVET